MSGRGGCRHGRGRVFSFPLADTGKAEGPAARMTTKANGNEP